VAERSGWFLYGFICTVHSARFRRTKLPEGGGAVSATGGLAQEGAKHFRKRQKISVTGGKGSIEAW
jgi:hypothetical protein